MALTPHYFYPPYGISIKTTALRNFQCSCHLLFVTYPYALTHLPLSPFWSALFLSQ
ncbi:hypothetical protein T4A_723 [Trichinella pseudospiralis]|uniref:Uncharacterized protein n=1 Tax=Trichinella pseudospiralis TaxID=6337 RepID=A0A0V1ECU7_TRIPS|nr:hypothetical protein T4A_723 [Trichinella pseudospiralis]